MALNLTNTVLEFLIDNADEKFTAREIADWVFREYPAECEKKKARSKTIDSDSALIDQIAREVSAQSSNLKRRSANINTTQERPKKYFWTEQLNQAEDSQEPIKSTAEIDLYPLMPKFLWSEFHLYSKRIDEKRSSNRYGKKGNKWLYPDLVGLEDLTERWHQGVKEVVNKHYSDKQIKLWSFEVKVTLNRSNIREAFFQAVSNSSWANVGYLAASSIEGLDTENELRMLSSLHGIGVLEINQENPVESKVLIPARERSEVDWAICSRLTQENKDFFNYIESVRQFHLIGCTRKEDWDPID